MSPDSVAVVPLFRDPQVILFSNDVSGLAAFYARLGFSETFRVPEEGEPIHVDLSIDGFRIGIASVASTRDDHGLDPVPAGQRLAVILWTDDTPAGLEAVVEAGGTRLSAPRPWLGRLLIAWAADPDGNPVQIVQEA